MIRFEVNPEGPIFDLAAAPPRDEEQRRYRFVEWPGQPITELTVALADWPGVAAIVRPGDDHLVLYSPDWPMERVGHMVNALRDRGHQVEVDPRSKRSF